MKNTLPSSRKESPHDTSIKWIRKEAQVVVVAEEVMEDEAVVLVEVQKEEV